MLPCCTGPLPARATGGCASCPATQMAARTLFCVFQGACTLNRHGGCAAPGEWSAGPKVFQYEGDATMGGLDKNLMRYETKCDVVLKSASWHCTDCFATIAAVKAKISGFSHWEKDRFPYNESTYIVDRRAPPLACHMHARRAAASCFSALLDDACMPYS